MPDYIFPYWIHQSHNANTDKYTLSNISAPPNKLLLFFESISCFINNFFQKIFFPRPLHPVIGRIQCFCSSRFYKSLPTNQKLLAQIKCDTRVSINYPCLKLIISWRKNSTYPFNSSSIGLINKAYDVIPIK